MSFEYARLASIGNQCKRVAQYKGASMAKTQQKIESKCWMIGVNELAPAEHVERVGRFHRHERHQTEKRRTRNTRSMHSTKQRQEPIVILTSKMVELS